MNEFKELKTEIRELKKLKLQMKAGSQDRIDLHRKIKLLKNKLFTLQGKIEPINESQDLELQEKNKIIEEILKYQPELKHLLSLHKYNIKQLKFHLQKLIERKNKGEILTYIKGDNTKIEENICIEKENKIIELKEKEVNMGKGRKAEAGTYEAREFVKAGNIEKLLEPCVISQEAKARILKAVKFGLGVK